MTKGGRFPLFAGMTKGGRFPLSEAVSQLVSHFKSGVELVKIASTRCHSCASRNPYGRDKISEK
ncbi:hypothetical protein OMAG_002579 [Candidatus Omnitrophus magneticus]|uniref:Uncharacterized protein n=1 Tax=Candidatus Omnitrophus magneticus TaxID=1609969 RepID=A0A0F0CNG4_9BACT|nr:hypothetical protein OMAG_002579 [Candidatus Omnitrophus magneticus]